MGNQTAFKNGKDHPYWKGGTTLNTRGYRNVRINGKYRLEHIVVMENAIGRKLSKDEVVHHINGNRLDNRLENLELLSRGEHSSIHQKGRIVTNETRNLLCQIRRGTNSKESHPQWKDITKENIEVALSKFKLKKEAAQFLGLHPDSLRHRIKYFGIGD